MKKRRILILGIAIAACAAFVVPQELVSSGFMGSSVQTFEVGAAASAPTDVQNAAVAVVGAGKPILFLLFGAFALSMLLIETIKPAWRKANILYKKTLTPKNLWKMAKTAVFTKFERGWRGSATI